jgi:hypothetical protein
MSTATSIRVTKETRDRLQDMKKFHHCKSIDELLNMLLDFWVGKRVIAEKGSEIGTRAEVGEGFMGTLL